MGKRLFPFWIASFLLCTWAWSQQAREERLLFINGEVIFEDGTHPEEPVLVEMLCNGSVRRQTFTHQGYFSLEFGKNTRVEVREASVEGFIRPKEFYQGRRDSLDGRVISAYSAKVQDYLDLSGCELRAVLPGFQSDSILLGRRSPLEKPDVGNIMLRGSDVKGTIVTPTTLKAPKKAKKAYQDAQKELRKKKVNYSKAAKELEKAVKEYPEFAAAWHLLGKVRLAREDGSGAHQAFKKAITADRKYVNPYLSLARMEFGQDRWEEVDRLSREVIALNPDMIYAHYLCAAANYPMGRLDLAEESARKVLDSKEAQRYPHTHFILAGVLAQRGNVASATAEFYRFLEVEPEGPLAEEAKQILADWERLGLIGKREAATVPDN